MSMTIEADRPMTTMIGVSHRGPYHEIGHAFMKLGEKLGAHQIKPTGPMVGIYLDDPHSVAPADLRSFA
ncbi:MAG: hypothetical protein SFX74_13215, partial [Fimbriimonadaceae bacterium]|nr:hypothetical protein [Fimbriimonadaceae bacterium]